MKPKLFILLIMAAALTAVAQRGGMGPGPGMKYDSANETKITGTIEDIKTTDAMCHAGTHLIVKTSTGNMEVGLGPSQFLQDQKLELKKGQSVEILGAKMAHQQAPVFVARQITAEGKTFNLRDEKGVPAWPRGSCGRP
ncbi:MAG TPA: hypothetical protein VHN74_05575 [Candidatus Angelobacter sp.]|jgi:hypothetical protein|nr:hypothetical protein [Candidatus Angelobacter sp.]